MVLPLVNSQWIVTPYTQDLARFYKLERTQFLFTLWPLIYLHSNLDFKCSPKVHLLKSLSVDWDIIKRYWNVESWALVTRFIMLLSGSRTLPLSVGLVLSYQGKKSLSALHTPHNVLPHNKPKSCGTENLLNVRRNNLLFCLLNSSQISVTIAES